MITFAGLRMGARIKNSLFRFVCILLALHIFNVSIDMPDGQPYDVPEDLSINEQESFIELVLEQWLGIENAVAEHDEPGDESEDLEIIKQFKLTHLQPSEIKFERTYTIAYSQFPDPGSYRSQYCSEITPPPPKA